MLSTAYSGQGTITVGSLVLVSALALAACAQTPPEQALRVDMAALQDAIERRDASAVQSYLAEDFIGPDGLDRKGARRLASLHLMQHDRIDMTLGPLEMEVRGQHATARFTAAMTGSQGRLLPDSGQIYTVETGWRIQGDHWLMTSAHWSRQL